MKIYLLKIFLIIIVGIPIIASGSSFVSSLVQGKTPTEAVSILGEQLDSLLSKVSDVESKQNSIDERIALLESENKVLQEKTKEIQISQACSNLEKDIPSKNGYDNWGDVSTVTKFYNRAQYLIESGIALKEETENQSMIAKSISELKPKYENYIRSCGGESFKITPPSVNTALCNNFESQIKDLEPKIKVLQEEQRNLKNNLFQSKTDNSPELFEERRNLLKENEDKVNKLILEKEKLEEQMKSNICGFKDYAIRG